MNKIYFDHLSAGTTEKELQDLFSVFGNVLDVNLAFDRTKKPFSFGFVTMDTPEGARTALKALHGKMIGTDALVLTAAWPEERRKVLANGRRDPRRLASSLY